LISQPNIDYIFNGNTNINLINKIRRSVFYRFGNPVRKYAQYLEIFNAKQCRELLSRNIRGNVVDGFPIYNYFNNIYRDNPDFTDQNLWLWIDWHSSLVDEMMFKADRASMGYGIEVRVPFLDLDFCEQALGIPYKLKTADGTIGKYPLRQKLSNYIPKNITELPKRGFDVPMHIVLNSKYFRPYLEKLFTIDFIKKIDLLNPFNTQMLWKQ